MEVLEILEYLGRTDVAIGVFVSVIVALVTWCYLSYNQPSIEIQKVEFVAQLGAEKKNNEEEEAKITEVGEEYLTDEEAKKMLLDDQDIEMIKKGEKLDTTDPVAVKHYVQEIRSMSYKGKQLNETEKEKEEEIKRKQLEQIFTLMNQQKEKFGETSLGDLEDQMSLYQG